MAVVWTRDGTVQDQIARELEESGVVALMSFNRRLDQDYRSMFDRVREGKIGKVGMIRITSRTFNFKSPKPKTVHFYG